MQFVPTFNFSFAILIIKYRYIQSYISYSKSSYLMKISNSNSAKFFSFSLLSFEIELTTTFTIVSRSIEMKKQGFSCSFSGK